MKFVEVLREFIYSHVAEIPPPNQSFWELGEAWVDSAEADWDHAHGKHLRPMSAAMQAPNPACAHHDDASLLLT